MQSTLNWKNWALCALALLSLSGCATKTSSVSTGLSDQLLSPPSVPMPRRPSEILQSWNEAVMDSQQRRCKRARLLGDTETPCLPDEKPSDPNVAK